MNYKNVLLGVLLVPFSMMGNNSTVYKKQLEENLFQKQVELSNLGAMIAEKSEYITSIGGKITELVGLKFNEKAKQLEEKKGGQSLSQEEQAQIYAELRYEIDDFYKNFEIAYQGKHSIVGILMNGLFQDDSFQLLEFCVLRCVFEQEILKSLVQKYEKHIEELVTIKIALGAL